MNNQPLNATEDKLKAESRLLATQINSALGAASRFKSQLQEAMSLLEQAKGFVPSVSWNDRLGDLKNRVNVLM